MINLAAVFVDCQPTASAKTTAPAFNVVVGDEKQSVRVAVWKDHAHGVDASAVLKGGTIMLTCLRVSRGKENTTELSDKFTRKVNKGRISFNFPRQETRPVFLGHFKNFLLNRNR